jgi:hypothetical protein
MNGINQMIAQGIQPPKFESPLNQFAQVEQIRQAQQTNALRQAQMQEIERERLSKNALNKAYADAFDPTKGTFDQTKLVQNLATSGQGSKISEVRKSLFETDKAKEELEKVRFEQFQKRIDFYTDEIANLKSPLEGQEWVRQLLYDPTVKRNYDQRGITEAQLIAQVPTDPAQFEQWKQQRALGAKKFVEMNKPQFLTRDLGGTSEVMAVPGLGGKAETVPGSVRRKTMTPGDEAAAQRAGGPERRLKQGERFNSETQTIEAIPGSDLFKKQKNKFTDEYSGAKTVLERTGTSVKKIDELLANKGFDKIFGGYTAYATRLMSGDAADARTRLDSLKSDFKALGKEIIAARGQSIGQITEREWPILEGLIDSLEPVLDEDVAKERLDEIKIRFRRMQENVVDAYETEFADSQFYKPVEIPNFTRAGAAGAGGRPPPAPAAGGVDMNNPLLR